MTPQQFYFNPDLKGIAVFIGPTGSQIMELLWRHDQLTVKQIQFYLIDKKLAYTTIMTILNRLLGKDLIKKRKQNRTYSYSPSISRGDFLELYTKIAQDGIKKAHS